MSNTAKVLLIEDNVKLTKLIEKGLSEEGYQVDIIYNGDDGLKKALDQKYDLLILDLMLPGKDGLAICRELRTKNISFPILVLTAKGAVEDKVEVLDSGADDYMVKPFDFEELLARMRNLTGRKERNRSSVLKVGALALDPVSHEVSSGAKSIELTLTEFKLLEYLMSRAGTVVTRQQIQKHIWGSEFHNYSNIVDTYIRYLRQKVGGKNKKMVIKTVRGLGYKIGERKEE